LKKEKGEKEVRNDEVITIEEKKEKKDEKNLKEQQK
jgi:hypothetical protein